MTRSLAITARDYDISLSVFIACSVPRFARTLIDFAKGRIGVHDIHLPTQSSFPWRVEERPLPVLCPLSVPVSQGPIILKTLTRTGTCCLGESEIAMPKGRAGQISRRKIWQQLGRSLNLEESMPTVSKSRDSRIYLENVRCWSSVLSMKSVHLASGILTLPAWMCSTHTLSPFTLEWDSIRSLTDYIIV